MFKKLNKKGFTLAELLVVVAIIGVLVAISIPIFTAQLEKAREATDMANIRAAYAEIAAEALTDDKNDHEATVTLKQSNTKGWVTAEADSNANIAGVKLDEINIADGTVVVKYTGTTGTSSGTITIGGKTTTNGYVIK